MEKILADKHLPENKATHFRPLAARSNYLAADRPECQYAAKEVCRFMSQPTGLSAEALKRIGRYLVNHPRLIYDYPFQERIDGLDRLPADA